MTPRQPTTHKPPRPAQPTGSTSDVDAARAAGCTWTPYYDLDRTRALTGLAVLVERGALDPTTGDRLGELLGEAFEAIPLAPLALTHTDASPGNAVWTPPGQAIPVDLEFACVAPVDLELENLFRNLFFLSDPSTSDRLAAITGDILTRPGACARLRGYAVLRDLWSLRGWLRNGGGSAGALPADLPTWAPVQHLLRHAAGTSWLRDIL